jgi:hypothetical protein
MVLLFAAGPAPALAQAQVKELLRAEPGEA